MHIFGATVNEQRPVSYATFAEGNKLRYGQDFRESAGVPAGVRFAVYPIAGSTMSKLVAPGYGELGGDYGNGALYLHDPITPDVAIIEQPEVG